MTKREKNLLLAMKRDQAISREERELYINQLVENNIGMAKHLVMKHYRKYSSQIKDELLAESMLALLTSANKWNPELADFWTYYRKWLHYYCSEFLRKNQYPLVIPRDIARKMHKGEHPRPVKVALDSDPAPK